MTQMTQIESRIDTRGDAYAQALGQGRSQAETLRARLVAVANGGRDAHIRRHRERGKLLVRERIDFLVDDGSPFLELSPLAA